MNYRMESTSALRKAKLLVHAIEEKARWVPHNTVIRYPAADWETAGYRAINSFQYAKAIDTIAYWLDSQLGSAADTNTVAYFAPSDPRYAMMMPAVIKTGRRILIPDGRNTTEGLQKLLASTNCKAWVYAEDDTNASFSGIDTQLKRCALPSLEWILSQAGTDRYPYDKTFEQAAHDVILIIHTSGTTGEPRPIYHTNGMWAVMGDLEGFAKRNWPRGIAHESWIGRTALNCCAAQWLGGLTNMVLGPVYNDSPCIMLPPAILSPSPELFKKLMSMNQVDGLKCPPQTIVTLYENLETRALLKSLRFIMYLGAALDRSIGDDLCLHTRLTPLIGSTETGDQMSFRPASRGLWYTHDFLPENGSKMVRIDSASSGNDLFELVLEIQRDDANKMFQPAFWNPGFHGIDRIETNELYTPILDSDGRTRWVFAARKDDLTKLSWLAKFHAHDLEARIQLYPNVKGVVVGGEGRPAPYVIVEIKEGVPNQKHEEQLLESIYATVIAGANDAGLNEIRIPKETVFLAKVDKPFRRNLKQVVMRKGVEEDYCEEIKQAYLELEKAQTSVVPSK